MLSPRDVGARVSVRRRVPEGRLTDVLGHLLDVTENHLEVLGPGEVLRLPLADVTAAKVVPPATPRRGWEVPAVSADDMQRICWAGWPAREVERLGDWVLRAHGGITGRANSAMAVGDPGTAVPDALRSVQAWYAERGLPPLLQLPLADPANQEMADAGWSRLHVTVVQVAPVAPVLARAKEPTTRAVVEPAPSSDWLSVMHDLDEDVDDHVAILAGPPVVGFATLYRGSDPLAIGRVSVEGDWCGITSVDVVPSARRRGLGTEVMTALLAWAQQQGATSSYLQVRAANPGALKLYDALGYVTHHPYGYRGPA